MTLLKTLVFALRLRSRMGYYQAGAQMCGGEERRAKADAYRTLGNSAGALLRAQVLGALVRARHLTGQSRDRP
jgi:hypothetical protein